MAGAAAGVLSVMTAVDGRMRQNLGGRCPVNPEGRLPWAAGADAGAATLPEGVLSVLGVCVFSAMLLPAARLHVPFRAGHVPE